MSSDGTRSVATNLSRSGLPTNFMGAASGDKARGWLALCAGADDRLEGSSIAACAATSA